MGAWIHLPARACDRRLFWRAAGVGGDAGGNQQRPQFEQSQRDADLDLRSATNEINALANTIAALNVAIASTPGSSDALRDRQSEALRALAGLIDIDVIARENGVNVAVGDGRALVAGENVYALTAVSAPPQGFAEIYSGSTNMTAEATGNSTGVVVAGGAKFARPLEGSCRQFVIVIPVAIPVVIVTTVAAGALLLRRLGLQVSPDYAVGVFKRRHACVQRRACHDHDQKQLNY